MPEVSFFYETRDFIDAYRRASRLAWQSRGLWISLAVTDIVLIGVFTFVAGPHNRADAFGAIAVAVVVCSLPAAWLAQRVSASLNGRRALKSEPVFREEFTYEIQPDCLIQRSKHGTTIVRWSDLKAFCEDNSIWLLYPDFLPQRFYILPKRHLPPSFIKALGDNLEMAGVPRR